MNLPVPESLTSFSVVRIFIIICSLSSLVQVQARQFYVGGRDGWVVHPKEDYDHWARRNRFLINDTLLFKYKKGENSVLLVNKDGYDRCDAHDPIKKWDDSNKVFQLDRSGPFYFISGQDGNCRNGQKLTVVVLRPRPLRLPPPKALPPQRPSPTPATAPGVAPGSKPPGSSTPATSPPPSTSPATNPTHNAMAMGPSSRSPSPTAAPGSSTPATSLSPSTSPPTTPTHAPAMGPSSLSPSPTAAPGSSTPATSLSPSTSPATTPKHASATGPSSPSAGSPSSAPTATAPASGPTAPEASGASPPVPSTTSPPPAGSAQSSPPAAMPTGLPGNRKSYTPIF